MMWPFLNGDFDTPVQDRSAGQLSLKTVTADLTEKKKQKTKTKFCLEKEKKKAVRDQIRASFHPSIWLNSILVSEI